MTDLWSFLLQTLTASGVAAMLLAVKWLLRDKLSPRWQYAVWGLLALALVLPVRRAVLFPWPLLVEAAKTLLTGEHSLTRVTGPVPLPALPLVFSVDNIIYYVYCMGVAVLLLRYLVAYLRLRRALGRGTPNDGAQVRAVAERYGLKPCRAVEVPGLSSAFVCGVFRPVLALPAGAAVDDKVILHELLHLKYRDVAWGLVTGLLRCLHWCNPLLWYCADRAGNDAEALCDQRVLERLEGEDRRDYGRILLSMADEKYARATGTSSLSNGGANIARRIDAIVRFKRYPRGMALASVCVAVVLAAPVLLGRPAGAVWAGFGSWEHPVWAMAQARAQRCTTVAGALDAYGKAVLTGNGVYRALCAPVADHAALAQAMEAQGGADWDSGLPGTADVWSGYFIYNLRPDGAGGYTALMVFPLTESEPVTGEQGIVSVYLRVATQAVAARRDVDGWTVEPLEGFQLESPGRMGVSDGSWLRIGNSSLPPAVRYTAEALGFRVDIGFQTVHVVDNQVPPTDGGLQFWSTATAFDLTPKPHAVFAEEFARTDADCTFLGSEAEKAEIRSVGVSFAPLEPDGSIPNMHQPSYGDAGGSSSDGSSWGSRTISEREDWDGTLSTGGGRGLSLDDGCPTGFAAILRVNDAYSGTLILTPVEGGAA